MMDADMLRQMEQFIVRAKRQTYVGGGAKLLPYRLGSKDLQVREGEWAYHDSYFGESDFLGQEIVYYQGQPVWGENYFGRILRTDLTTSAEMGQMIMRSLSALYQEGRFLGGFEHAAGDLRYVDRSEGDAAFFTGREAITRGGVLVYELVYHGGLLRGPE